MAIVRVHPVAIIQVVHKAHDI